MDLTPATYDLAPYLESSEVVDWREPNTLLLSQRLLADCGSDEAKARAAYEWMQAEIPHSRDTGREEVTCSASDVLRLRTGICFAQSHLLAALLRAVGVPTGFCYQITDAEGSLHGFNGVNLGERWVALDARGTAPYDAERGSLAFPHDPLLDGMVYARPLGQVVQALRGYSTVTTLWPNLPNRAAVSV